MASSSGRWRPAGHWQQPPRQQVTEAPEYKPNKRTKTWTWAFGKPDAVTEMPGHVRLNMPAHDGLRDQDQGMKDLRCRLEGRRQVHKVENKAAKTAGNHASSYDLWVELSNNTTTEFGYSMHGDPVRLHHAWAKFRNGCCGSWGSGTSLWAR